MILPVDRDDNADFAFAEWLWRVVAFVLALLLLAVCVFVLWFGPFLFDQLVWARWQVAAVVGAGLSLFLLREVVR